MKSHDKPFLWTPDGRRWYVRKGGLYRRIRADYGTPEFDAIYWQIMGGRGAAAGRSFGELIESYKASDRWARIAPRTRRDYEPVLAYIAEKNGARDATRTLRRDVLAAMEANRHRVRFANLICTVLSQLFERAIDLGLMKDNPARGVVMIRTPAEKRQPHVPWPDWAVDRFRADATPRARLIFELGVGSVQRPGDWPRFNWGDYDGDTLRVVQGKTAAALVLPCTAVLRDVLDAARPAGAAPGEPILKAERGGGRLAFRTMQGLMLDERQRLGLAAFDLHALRYRGIQELAWAGCTDDEIAAYSGHTTLAMVRKYAGEARQIMRARQARQKRP